MKAAELSSDWGPLQMYANRRWRPPPTAGAEPAPAGSIAVVLHAYYPDVFDALVPYLDHLPWRFDLYVSVTDQKAHKHIRQQAQFLSRVGEQVVTVVPNRGRDIAPLLVTFADAAMEHDYILHLHTKKSLYTGGENTTWRDYLFTELLGSWSRVAEIYDRFTSNPDLGLVYPETFEGLPHWTHAWLQNERDARDLAERLDIEIDFDQYVDAPTGSMFCLQYARTRITRAIRPRLFWPPARPSAYAGADFPFPYGDRGGFNRAVRPGSEIRWPGHAAIQGNGQGPAPLCRYTRHARRGPGISGSGDRYCRAELPPVG